MNKLNLIIGAVVALVLVLGTAWVVGGNNQSTSLDLGSGTRFPNGISADSTSPSSGQVRGATFTSTGDLVVGVTDLFVDTSTDKVGIGTTTPVGNLHVEVAPDGDGTIASTTVSIGQIGTTTSVGQFEMKQQDGGVSCVYLNSEGTAFVFQDGICNL